MTNQQFCLKWNKHTSSMLSIFQDLQEMNVFVDVTLACDGLSLKAHKLVLSACSDFFRNLFIDNPCKHPVVIMKDVTYKDLKAILEFMYHGEVNVSQDQLSTLLKTAEMLRVKGLTEAKHENNQSKAPMLAAIQPSVLPSSILKSTILPQKRAGSPPGRHRKPRARKRSCNNFGDNEIVPTKIKEANSPKVEDISVELTKSNHSHISCTPNQASHSSSVNIHSLSVMPHSSPVQGDHPTSEGESEYDMEPSKLLEQTLTSPDVSSDSALPILGLSNDMLLVPTNDNNQFHELDCSNIKQEISESDSYMDQSSLPGPSGMQDSTALVPQDPQSQGIQYYKIPSVGPNPIWDYFEKHDSKATCKICNKSLSLGSSLPKKQTITNIKNHLAKIHKSEWEAYSEANVKHQNVIKLRKSEMLNAPPKVSKRKSNNQHNQISF